MLLNEQRLRACLKNVAAGVSPAVEAGILPPGHATENLDRCIFSSGSAGPDARLDGSRRLPGRFLKYALRQGNLFSRIFLSFVPRVS